MTTQYKTKAFVFKKNDRNESDRVFSVFTNNFGRLDIYAKAIRKITSKLRPNIDIFYFSDIEFIQGKSHKTLIDAVKIKEFNDIAIDINKLKTIYKVSSILDGFIKGQEKDSATFDLLSDFLIKLRDSSIKNNQLAYQYFFWNFISLQGYKVEVDNCAICKIKLNPYNIYFSSKEGGIICGTCAGFKKTCPEPCQRINSDIVKTLRLIFKKDWQTISKLKIEPSSQKLLEDLSKNAVHTFCPVHC